MKLTTEQSANLIDILNTQAGGVRIKDLTTFKRKLKSATPFLLHKDGKYIGGVTLEILNENQSNRELISAIKRQLEKSKEKKGQDTYQEIKIKTEKENRFRSETYSHRNKLRILANMVAEEKANEIYQKDFEESMEEIDADMQETIESLREELEELQQEADNGDINLEELETGRTISNSSNTESIDKADANINLPTNINNQNEPAQTAEPTESSPGSPGSPGSMGANTVPALNSRAGSITDPANAIATISSAAEEIIDSIDKVLKDEESKEELLIGQTNQPNNPSVTTPEALEASLPTIKSGRNMSPLERARLLAAEITQMIQKKKAVTKKRNIQKSEPEPSFLGIF